MMYNDVKLEKGMYHLAGKSFLQALEEADPQAQYAGTPLAALDAYERQLKRFDIRVNGAGCDRVEKFFTTTESAVLFPEFVRRAIVQGMREAVLDEITAVVTRCESNRYQGVVLTETAAYSTTNEGSAMPDSTITESDSVVSLAKYGRTIKASYEAVRQQKLDVFALMLRRVGKELADSVTGAALDVLVDSVTATSVTGLAYGDLAALYGSFTSFDMKAVLVSPGVMAQILVMDEMLEASSKDVTEIRLPFGTRLINCKQLDDDTVIGLDTDFALEQIRSSEVVLETDKLIDRQLDCIGVSINVGFRALMSGAVKVLEIT
ncbi:MAG: phage major capsid protein [Oscillospiraceae bacterium]|nr:phage major capsid protein [Oscillospiraceae bacterium]